MGVYKLYYSTVNKCIFENNLKVGYGYYIEFMQSDILVDYYHCAEESYCNALIRELELDYDVRITQSPLDDYVNGFKILVMMDPAERPTVAEEYIKLYRYLKIGGRLLFNYIPRNQAKHERLLQMTSSGYPLIERIFGRPILYTDNEILPEDEGFNIVTVGSEALGRKVGVDVCKIPIPLKAIIKDPNIYFYYPFCGMHGNGHKPIIEISDDMRAATMDVNEEDGVRKSGLAWFKRTKEVDGCHIVMHREFIKDNLDWGYMYGALSGKVGFQMDEKSRDEIGGEIVRSLGRRVGIIGQFSNCVGYAIGICANPFDDECINKKNSVNLKFAKHLFSGMLRGSTMSSRPITEPTTDARVVRERQKKQQPDRIDFPFTMP